MSTHHHERLVCSCGAVIMQCRCIEPKTDKVVQNGCEKCEVRRPSPVTPPAPLVPATLDARELIGDCIHPGMFHHQRDYERAAKLLLAAVEQDWASALTSKETAVASLREELAEARKETNGVVFLVSYSNYGNDEIDGVYATRELANAAVEKLGGGMWEVYQRTVRTALEDE